MLQVLDAALAPRLAHLQVLAVEDLQQVWLLPVENARMAAAEGVVEARVPGREGEGHSWLQRKRQCLALLLEGSGGAAEDAAAAAAGGAADGVGGDGEEAPRQAAAAEADSSSSSSRTDAGSSHTADASTPPPAAAEPEFAAVTDVLYVIRPECLIECSTQVARELGGFVVQLAAAVGLQQQLDSEGLCMLLDKLLMVQVSCCTMLCYVMLLCCVVSCRQLYMRHTA
jgi:hypothetical protein